MKAAILKEYGEPLEIEDIGYPEPDPDGAIVESVAVGICRSDWHGWQGDWQWIGAKPPKGHVLGHEPAGKVVEVGDEVEQISEGDMVAVPFNLADGTCDQCRNGRSNVCENLKLLGFSESTPGAFAEAFHVPAADFNAVPLPDGVDPIDMAGLGCRFMTSFHGLAHRVDVEAGDWVAVNGIGGIGQSAVHIADALGANVVAVDLMDEKLAKAEELGAVETVNASDVDDVPTAVKGITNGGADVAVDALGIEETCQNTMLSLGRRGQHLQIGLTTSDEEGMVSLPTDAAVTQELEFYGSLGMPPTRYDEIFRMVAHGALDPGAVVSETVALEDVSDKLEAMNDFDTMGIPVITEF
ncbi:alcohol dehydrogenase GroES domain protein [Halodesulfurarchaeum formicicum]|uniref:Alcohol dehydrogenase GroES domain protein n=1 Tax=Halodesulfurarchaeum formicicum TaxID=1873524 RepID=A0A1D8S2T1_9EURY|nr:zinc-dependent alcohol dehydrogenase family protein [Halodesulfurarchaeum formicicum]AOW79674.1 alcohol dehydrogenase GroES domain protein [Halodesulfurarchaeum formicicum]